LWCITLQHANEIIVDTPEDYQAWLKDKTTVVNEVKASLAAQLQLLNKTVDSSSAKKE
jgi:cytochrome c oxidase subunit 2